MLLFSLIPQLRKIVYSGSSIDPILHARGNSIYRKSKKVLEIMQSLVYNIPAGFERKKF